jgi:hypothetical protein
MFFFCALVNPRDFPISNLPLIYPGFLLFSVLMGLNNIVKGFRRTKLLWVLLITAQGYSLILGLVFGNSFRLVLLAYPLEGFLFLGAAGAATVVRGGTKAALSALLFIIVLSAASGIWIVFIGEPVQSWKSTLQSSIGGNLLKGTYVCEIDQRDDAVNILEKTLNLKINSGLTREVFSFSYQIGAAILITIIALLRLSMQLSRKQKLSLVACFLILGVSVVTNGERATLASVAGVLLLLLLTQWKYLLKFRVVVYLLIFISISVVVFSYAYDLTGNVSRIQRSAFHGKTLLRLTIIPVIAFESILHEPLGCAGMSDQYKRRSASVGYVGSEDSYLGPHNHFIVIMMYTGVVGFVLIMMLFWQLWKKLKYVRSGVCGFEEMLLGFVCVGLIIHSLFHNTGFFAAEPTTLIVFGLLWGATAYNVRRRSRQRIMSG